MWNDHTATADRVRSAHGDRLSPLELAAWRGLLRIQAQTMRSLEARMTAAHQLTNADYEILLRLSEQPGARMRMAALAQAIIRPKSTLTRVVSGLVARGLVHREDDAADRRGASAVLSGKGREVFRAAQRTHLSELRASFLDRLEPHQLAHLADAWHAIDSSVLLPAPDEPMTTRWTAPVLVLVELTPHARHADPLRAEVDAVVERIRTEDACLSIEAWSALFPPRILLVERWRSSQDLRDFRHGAAYLASYLERTDPYLRQPRRVITVSADVSDSA